MRMRPNLTDFLGIHMPDGGVANRRMRQHRLVVECHVHVVGLTVSLVLDT